MLHHQVSVHNFHLLPSLLHSLRPAAPVVVIHSGEAVNWNCLREVHAPMEFFVAHEPEQSVVSARFRHESSSELACKGKHLWIHGQDTAVMHPAFFVCTLARLPTVSSRCDRQTALKLHPPLYRLFYIICNVFVPGISKQMHTGGFITQCGVEAGSRTIS